MKRDVHPSSSGYSCVLGMALVVTLATAGCGLTLRVVDASVKRPSNVAIYLHVADHEQRGVPNLSAADFVLYEDGKLIAPVTSQQTLLADQLAAAKYTLLLLDMSGSFAEPGARGPLVDAVATFADRVSKTQEVAVCAFDGSAQMRPLVLFAAGGGVVKGDLDALRTFAVTDPSDNLNGAVVAGMTALRKQMERTQQPLRVGTLVVFTDSTDHAHRVGRDKVTAAIDAVSDHIGVVALGVGPDADADELSSIGRQGFVLERNRSQLKRAFDEITRRVDDDARAYYLLSYCSPARAGTHELRVALDVKHRGAGSLSYGFEADGFAPRCDPNQRPVFAARRDRGARQLTTR